MEQISQKCKNPACSNTFPLKPGKSFCCSGCKSMFHNRSNAVLRNAENREMAKFTNAGRKLGELVRQMKELGMQHISAESLLLAGIPIHGSTRTIRNPQTKEVIKWYCGWGIEPIDEEATKFIIHNRELWKKDSQAKN